MCSTKVDILQNSCSTLIPAEILGRIFKKANVKESNYSKVAAFQPATLIKLELLQNFFSRILNRAVEHLF